MLPKLLSLAKVTLLFKLPSLVKVVLFHDLSSRAAEDGAAIQNINRILTLILTCCFLTACGQYGSLHLPQEPSAEKPK